MEDTINRPLGDLLEEILHKGIPAYPDQIRRYHACQTANRVAILLGGLALGPALQEALNEWSLKTDSPEKFSLMIGLSHMGHPDAERYFLRYLPEKKPEKVTRVAIEALSRLRSEKYFEFLVKCVDDPYLFPAVADALVNIGGERAGELLLPHTERWEGFEALAKLAYPKARPLFIRALRQGPPMDAAAATALGKIGNPEDGERLSPLIGGKNHELSRAAFISYAKMGAPQGPEPLLRVAAKELQPWMVEPLSSLDSPEVYSLFMKNMESSKAGSLLKKMVFWKQEVKTENSWLYRGLRNCQDPAVAAELAVKLRQNPSKAELRALLQNKTLFTLESAEKDLLGLVQGNDLYASYLATRGWLNSPSTSFMTAAMKLLRMPGYVELDAATAIMDPQHLLESRSAELNPVLLVGRFLESGLVDLQSLQEKLKERLGQKKFPAVISPRTRFSALEDGGFGPFLEALGNAHSTIREELSRIWELFIDIEDESVPLFELFWSESGLHRGGIQRLIMRSLDGSVRRWIEGKDDRFLSELDSVESTIPRDGPLAARILGSFSSARVKLMSECKDIVVWMEGGGQRGDIVLIEKL
ncbi:HEAT repeat domain-containing protein [bacterium]|nr:MAG: HEAT repeat domain-containing protein [bacterium]